MANLIEPICVQKIKNASSFLKKVKNAIIQKGVKQNFVAEQTGINHVHLSRVLNQKSTLTEDVMEKLNNYFWPTVKKK